MKLPKILNHEIIDNGLILGDEKKSYWLKLNLDSGEEVALTLNEDGTIYLKNPDGGALEESEAEFKNKYEDESWYQLFLEKASLLLTAEGES